MATGSAVRGSQSSDIHNGLCEVPWGFLRQVVANPTVQRSMRVLAREPLRVRSRSRVGCAVGVTLEGNGRHGDVRACSKALFQFVILGLALGRGRQGYEKYRRDFARLIWQLASPKWTFDDATFERQSKPPAIVVDDNADMIRIVESGRTASVAK